MPQGASVGCCSKTILQVAGWDLLLLARSSSELDGPGWNRCDPAVSFKVGSVSGRSPACLNSIQRSNPGIAFLWQSTPRGRGINKQEPLTPDHCEMTLKAIGQWLIQLNLTQRVPGLSVRFGRFYRQFERFGWIHQTWSSLAARKAFPEWGAY